MKFAKDEHGLLGLNLPCGWISFNDEDKGGRGFYPPPCRYPHFLISFSF